MRLLLASGSELGGIESDVPAEEFVNRHLANADGAAWICVERTQKIGGLIARETCWLRASDVIGVIDEELREPPEAT